MINRIGLVVVLAVVSFCLFIGAWSLLNGEITFHVDIARDFMLMNQMVEDRKLDLIGPRSSIPGFFHGPLWYYINLPAFVVAHGNPILVGWFWLGLIGVNIYLIYTLVSRMFGAHTGLLAAVFFATLTPNFANQLFNPYGSLFLFPLVLYFNYVYLVTRRARFMALLAFTYGLIFQFQTAFAAPVLLTNLVYLSLIIIKQRNFSHYLALGSIVLPLSTFLVFDLRHNFLQTRSVLAFLGSSSAETQSSMTNTLADRMNNILFVGLNPAADTTGIGSYLGLLVFVLLVIGAWGKHPSSKFFYRPSLALYLGFWLLMSFYRGEVWQFYYWPFVSLGVIVLSSLPQLGANMFTSVVLRRRVRFVANIFVSLIIMINLAHVTFVRFVNADFPGIDASSWLFNQRLAHQIYQDADGDFGYFIFTPELYAYTPKYAMLYTARFYPNLQIHPSAKLPLTYLIMAPAPDYRPDLTGSWWQVGQVRIDQEPESVFTHQNGYQVKRFALSPDAQTVEVDPLMLDTLMFR